MVSKRLRIALLTAALTAAAAVAVAPSEEPVKEIPASEVDASTAYETGRMEYMLPVDTNLPLGEIYLSNNKCGKGPCLEERLLSEYEKWHVGCNEPIFHEGMSLQKCSMARQGNKEPALVIIIRANYIDEDINSEDITKEKKLVYSTPIQLIMYDNGKPGLNDGDSAKAIWHNPGEPIEVTHSYIFNNGIVERWTERDDGLPIKEVHEHHQGFWNRSKIWLGKKMYGIDGKYNEVIFENDGSRLEEYTHKVVHFARKRIANYLEKANGGK